MKFSTKTQALITEYTEKGYTIITNQDPCWNVIKNRTQKSIVKLDHTNDKMNGWVKRIVWAVK